MHPNLVFRCCLTRGLFVDFECKYAPREIMFIFRFDTPLQLYFSLWQSASKETSGIRVTVSLLLCFVWLCFVWALTLNVRLQVEYRLPVSTGRRDRRNVKVAFSSLSQDLLGVLTILKVAFILTYVNTHTHAVCVIYIGCLKALKDTEFWWMDGGVDGWMVDITWWLTTDVEVEALGQPPLLPPPHTHFVSLIFSINSFINSFKQISFFPWSWTTLTHTYWKFTVSEENKPQLANSLYHIALVFVLHGDKHSPLFFRGQRGFH